jgi:hypothetical protein
MLLLQNIKKWSNSMIYLTSGKICELKDKLMTIQNYDML